MQTKRKWSSKEKLAILKEAEIAGVTATLRKHKIFGPTFYAWKNSFAIEGINGLEKTYKKVDPELKRLQFENHRLKQIIADKELALRIKDELLKKTSFRNQSKL